MNTMQERYQAEMTALEWEKRARLWTAYSHTADTEAKRELAKRWATYCSNTAQQIRVQAHDRYTKKLYHSWIFWAVVFVVSIPLGVWLGSALT